MAGADRAHQSGAPGVEPSGARHSLSVAHVTLDELRRQCQAVWRTDITLVCCLPKDHAGDHQAANPRFTWNGEVDVRAEPAKPLRAALQAIYDGIMKGTQDFDMGDIEMIAKDTLGISLEQWRKDMASVVAKSAAPARKPVHQNCRTCRCKEPRT